jgi:ferredoxin
MISSQLNQATRALPVPPRMQSLRVSPKGYITPWFVAWFEDGHLVPRGHGTPDFRCVYPGAVQEAVQRDLCWLCGERLGRYKTFVIGPMATVNRTTAEPPSHKSCAKYAVRACPFLAQPKMVRNDKDLPEHDLLPGEMILRNPGVSVLWTTMAFHIQNGLFRLGPPQNVEWWAKGRPATRAEVEQSIASGLPLLAQTCQGDEACLAELGEATAAALDFLPKP